MSTEDYPHSKSADDESSPSAEMGRRADETRGNEPPTESGDAASGDGGPPTDGPGSLFAQSPKGHPLVAWAVIIALVASILAARSGQTARATKDATTLRIMEMQGRYLVGIGELPMTEGIPGFGDKAIYDEARMLNTGPVRHRLCFVVLGGELAGPEEAVELLEELQDQMREGAIEPSATDAELLRVLETLYESYREEDWSAESLEQSDRDLLRSALGWFGQLALAPAEGPDEQAREQLLASARQTAATMLIALGVGVLAAFGGLVAAVSFFVAWLLRVVGSRIVAGSSRGGIYAETFAVWMLLFMALGVGASFLGAGSRTMQLVTQLVAFGISLSALGWPMLRGISWQEVRSDIGWTLGRNPVVEVLSGVACYIAALPAVALGLMVTTLLMQSSFARSTEGGGEFTSGGIPSHPIVNWVSDSGVAGWLLVFAIAAVAAPVIEETMFRGVLYRHLRDATARWRISLSVAASVLVNSFLFAVIHPQGMLGLPVLMVLAVAFSLAREWRDSLIAPMTAHAANNGIMTCLLIAMF